MNERIHEHNAPFHKQLSAQAFKVYSFVILCERRTRSESESSPRVHPGRWGGANIKVAHVSLHPPPISLVYITAELIGVDLCT